MDEIEFDNVDWASAGSVGEPGKQMFMIQGRKENSLVAVLVERHQIEMLANQSIEFLDSIKSEFPEEVVATPYEFEMAGTIAPIEPIFRAQSMGLIFDPDSKLVTLELRECPFDDDIDNDINGYTIIPQPHDGEHIFRLTMTRSQLRAMAVRGTESINFGHDLCPLCQVPIVLETHICPRLN